MSEATKTKDLIGYSISKNENNFHKKPPAPKDKKKIFKGGPMNIIKVALYMLRKKGDKESKKSSPAIPTGTNATLTNFVGAFRPLHLQNDVGMSPPPRPPPGMLPPPHEGLVPEVMASPFNNPRYASFSSSSSRSSSTGGGLSRYASIENLYDLDNHDDAQEDEENDEDAYYDGLAEGDEMIDIKAEMFIANFYQQMRLQESN